MSEPLKLSGIIFFLMAAGIFSSAIWFGPPQGRYNPEGVPATVINQPVLWGIMMIGPLFYIFGARMKRKPAKVKANSLLSKG